MGESKGSSRAVVAVEMLVDVVCFAFVSVLVIALISSHIGLGVCGGRSSSSGYRRYHYGTEL